MPLGGGLGGPGGGIGGGLPPLGGPTGGLGGGGLGGLGGALGGLGGPGGGLGGPAPMPGMGGQPMVQPKQIKPINVWDILEKILDGKPMENKKETEPTRQQPSPMVQNVPQQPAQPTLMGLPGT